MGSPARSASVLRFVGGSGTACDTLLEHCPSPVVEVSGLRNLQPDILCFTLPPAITDGGGPIEPIVATPVADFALRSLTLVSRSVRPLLFDMAGRRDCGSPLGRTFSNCEGGRSIVVWCHTVVQCDHLEAMSVCTSSRVSGQSVVEVVKVQEYL